MRKKQGILVIADGLGDRPIKELGYQTPLERAKTPNLDFLASKGMCGNVYPIAPGIPVGTDVGHIQIFGYDQKEVYTGRGPIEALSGGIELLPGDIAFRGNFATIDESHVVIDRRAGRIKNGTAELAQCINGMILDNGVEVLTKELTDHRVAVVFRGENLSDEVCATDPGTAEEGKKLVYPEALNEYENTKKMADNIWQFTLEAYEKLKDYEINIKREEKGLLPANAIILRGPGLKTEMKSIKSLYGVNAACIAGDLTINGIGKMVGMDTFTDKGFTGNFDTDYDGKMKMVLKCIKDGYDWVVVHIKATDLAGHDNLPHKKIEVIEKIDDMMEKILQNIDLSKCYVSLTADHSTPCEARDHTGDSVPTIIAGADVRKDNINKAGEKYFVSGSLNNLTANDIFMLQMDLMGFTKKVGA